ncbi:hypothetical protein Clacol_006891 [Clathrus columnatus]|uniref:Dihydrodipicolinate synthetase n=1 Tax=Clathrus columnatus TaxID=1419009 RepID=A0AAV5ADD1_9AGAM|nr:hypothetical protein Clacol_006891 [Clathrus columnatus]
MALNGHSNGTTTTRTRTIHPGVFAPIPAFFHPESEELDIQTFQEHVVYVARSGVGLVINGSMGEAHHLSREERSLLVRSARSALDSADPPLLDVPIIAGTGAGSTKENLVYSQDAAEAGADAVIVITSGYYAGAIDRQALKVYFTEIATKSPLPVMIYNYPGASGGLDMDSDLIEELARDNLNLCGVKLTCGNVGKLTRIAATVSTSSFIKAHPRHKNDAPFLVLGGFIDFLVPSIYANAHGAITGLGNVAPVRKSVTYLTSPILTLDKQSAIRRLYDLSIQSLTDPSVLPKAQELQGIIARADRTVAVTGIAGTKYLLQRTRGYGGVPRRPLLPTPEDIGEKLLNHPHVVALYEAENNA